MPRLFLDGQEISWITGSLSVEDSIGERSMLGFTYYVPQEDAQVQRGMQVYFYAPDANGDEEIVFAGMVDNYQEVVASNPNDTGMFYTITCTDWTTYTDRRVMTGTFKNESSGEILNDLVYDYMDVDNIYTHPYPGALVTIARTNLIGYWRLNGSPKNSGWLGGVSYEFGTVEYTAENARTNPDFVAADSSPVRDVESGGHGDFNGTDSRIRTGIRDLDFNTYLDGGYTVDIWLLHDGTSTTWSGAIALGNSSSMSSGSQDNIFSLRKHADTSGGTFHFYFSTGVGQTPNIPLYGFELNEWQHWTITADNVAGKIKGYLNGALVHTGSLTPGTLRTTTTNQSHISIGTSTGNAHSWSGYLSEAAVLGRVLTPEEVATVHRAAGPSYARTVRSMAPLAYWPLDDVVPNTDVADETGNYTGHYTINAVAGGPSRVLDYESGSLENNGQNTFLGPNPRTVSFNPSTYTYAGWVYVDTLDFIGAIYDVIQVDSDETGEVVGFRVQDGTPSGSAYNFRLFARNAANTAWDIGFTTPTSFTTKGVHHLAVMWDGTTWTAYVDGQSIGSTTSAPLTGANAQFVSPGGDTFGNDTSRISHWAAWGRALTAAEVADLHAKGGDYYSANNLDQPSNRAVQGFTPTAFIANYSPATAVLEELAELSSVDSFIDTYRTVHFHGRGARCCTLPITIDSSLLLSGSVMRQNKDAKYRNRQMVKGGRDKTVSQTEIITASADQEAFALGFKVGELTTVELNTGGGYVTQTVAVKGAGGSADFYYERGSEILVTETTINSGDLVRVTYIGQYDVVVISSDQAEIDTMRHIEKSGSATVDAVLTDTNILSRQQGFEVANGKLDRYASRSNIFSFSTRSAGIRSGQVGPVTVLRHNMDNEEAIIESVSIYDEDGIELRYRVTASTGAVLRTWQSFFGTTVLAAQKAGDRENPNEEEIITILVDMSETTTIGESGTSPIIETCAILGATMPFTLC